MTKQFHTCSKCRDDRSKNGNAEPERPTQETEPITIDRSTEDRVRYETEAGSCGAIKED